MMKIPREVLEEAEEAGRSMLAELLEDGDLTVDEALDLISAVGDALIPLRLLLPAPWGALSESADRAAIRGVLAKIESSLRRDPDKIEARAERAAERGHFAVANRRRARAARIRAREED